MSRQKTHSDIAVDVGDEVDIPSIFLNKPSNKLKLLKKNFYQKYLREMTQ